MDSEFAGFGGKTSMGDMPPLLFGFEDALSREVARFGNINFSGAAEDHAGRGMWRARVERSKYLI